MTGIKVKLSELCSALESKLTKTILKYELCRNCEGMENCYYKKDLSCRYEER